jgi:hypothetical protein
MTICYLRCKQLPYITISKKAKTVRPKQTRRHHGQWFQLHPGMGLFCSRQILISWTAFLMHIANSLATIWLLALTKFAAGLDPGVPRSVMPLFVSARNHCIAGSSRKFRFGLRHKCLKRETPRPPTHSPGSLLENVEVFEIRWPATACHDSAW